MTLTLVRPSDTALLDAGRDGFIAWLTSSCGTAHSTAAAYAGDVARVGLDPTWDRDRHVVAAEGIAGSDLAAATRVRRLAACAKFYDYAHPHLTEGNPYRTVRRPRQGVTLPTRVADPDESRQVIEALLLEGTRSVKFAAACALMAGAGLRVGEAVTVTWGRLDPARGVIRVTGKGDKTRDVPVGEYAMTVLRRAFDVASERAAVRPTDRICDASVRTVQRTLSRVSQDVGVRSLNPHALRHGYGTAVYEGTDDLVLVKDLLGHAHIQTTQIYVHTSDKRREFAASLAL